MQLTRENNNASRVGTITTPKAISTSTSYPPLGGPSTSTLSESELIKREFYATYDVMTGVRIAATLGGFFGLVVILVVYKSKSKTEKALNDPYLAAVAAEAVAEAEADLQEEEELALQAALEATAIWSMNPRSERTARQSLGNMSAPSTIWGQRTPRFSSVGGGGGYANLFKPPIRSPYKDKTSPGSTLRFHNYNVGQHLSATNHRNVKEMSSNVDDADDAFDELDDDFHSLSISKRNSFSRRFSSITCSSSDSSYLERRGSAVVGLPPPPVLPITSNYRRRSSGEKCCWDFYYPIDIQVIQPTPTDLSPSSSERCVLYDTVPGVSSADIQTNNNLVVPERLAPLATISSCASSVLGTDIIGELDQRSIGSDSVFVCDENYDTDDEITQFSTDSEQESLITPTLTIDEDNNKMAPSSKYVWKRRSSAPLQRRRSMKQYKFHTKKSLLKPSKSIDNIQLKSTMGLGGGVGDNKSSSGLLCIQETQFYNNNSSAIVDRYKKRLPLPLPSSFDAIASTSDTLTLVATNTNISDDVRSSISLNMAILERRNQLTNQGQRLTKSSSSLVNIEIGGTSSHETLF